MPIIKITGGAKSGKTFIANALRNSAIANGRGALIVDEQTDGEFNALVEKILAGVGLPDPVPLNWADTLPFKKEPVIIFVGSAVERLAEFEEKLPGFTEKFSPVFGVATELQ
jgi:hypothetical protein